MALPGLAMKVGLGGLFCDFGPPGSHAAGSSNSFYCGCIYRDVV
jgi:hypothetical protein